MDDVVAIRVPGRVNLIGDHTDYNDGFALPAAIDLGLTVTARRRGGDLVRVVSDTEPEPVVVTPTEPTAGTGWGGYVAGAVAVLREHGVTVSGADVRVEAELPPGRGLSSSAALVLGLLVALGKLNGTLLDPGQLARLAQRVEHEWAGVRCGLMDFLAILSGVRDHALLIDCRADDAVPVPLPGSVALLVLDPGRPRSLDASAYNERRSECEQAVAAIRRLRPSVTALRDVSSDDLPACAEVLPDTLFRRARHVVSENDRVLAVRAALEAGDLDVAGRLMTESHASLRDDFEVSTPELDSIVEVACATDGVYGARLTGAGFGGCAVALAEHARAPAAAEAILRRFRGHVRADAAAYVCRAADGVKVG